MYKIAVIEDDTLLGQALVEMLTSHGYQAFAAESVTKARRLMERQPVDLLFRNNFFDHFQSLFGKLKTASRIDDFQYTEFSGDMGEDFLIQSVHFLNIP